uniref:Transcriptional adapter 2-alpha-like n=1 Tax=Saccoglossus kowalevskii TaxID=10224 RepID=A0ABM0M1C3_SACKO|nr:PREDICTED: transcriptional adapter 2-alpha-like [Saccoglossus kowalevskii]
MASPDDRPPCPGCSSYLIEPFIRCDVCGPPLFYLCLQCFSRGWEGDGHENNHAYEIITNDFSVLDHRWTAKEELALLEAVGDCGLGNWIDVSNQVQTKSKWECEHHYLNTYIMYPKSPLPVLPIPDIPQPSKPILCKISEDPPRPAKDSQRATDMAGYIAARGDFTEEYDNYVEWDVKDVYFADDDERLLTALKMSVVQIFYSRLRERHKRKRITFHAGTRLYEKLKMRREEQRYKCNMLTDVLGYVEDQNACQQWLQKQALLDSGQMFTVFPSISRKSAPPLDVKSFPGYDKLTEAEKEMCAHVRIIPEAYFEYKKILVSECNKQGFLRLKQARNLIKIDVNKTRKLFDFMVQQGMLNIK